VVAVHAFFALLAGLATAVILGILFDAAIKKSVPEWTVSTTRPTLSQTFVSLGSSFLTAAVGGFVTASASAANPLLYVLVLAIIVLAIAALGTMQAREAQPIRYALAAIAISPIGVVAGGLLRLRTLGVI
jgi:hypothetical protein